MDEDEDEVEEKVQVGVKMDFLEVPKDKNL